MHPTPSREDAQAKNSDTLLPLTAATAAKGISTQRYLVRTSDFIKLFNKRVDAKRADPNTPERDGPGWKISQRTLLFYSAPNLRLMPKPLLCPGLGHKGHYIVPDHLDRLESIQLLKEHYFLPLWTIRDILDLAPRPLEPEDIRILAGAGPLEVFLDLLPFVGELSLEQLRWYVFARTLLRGTGRSEEECATYEEFKTNVSKALKEIQGWLESDAGRATFELVEKEGQKSEFAKAVKSWRKQLRRTGNPER